MTVLAPDVGERAKTDAGWTLIYDGDCDFCRRCVRLLARWDTHRRVRTAPFQDAGALAGLPTIPRAALEAAMQLVTPSGGVLGGARAAPSILRLLPGGRPLAALLHLPGVPALAGRVYAAVARNRHRLGCGSAACTRGR